MSRDKNGVMELDEPEGEGAVEAMEKLGKEFSSLEGFYPGPRSWLYRKSSLIRD